MSVFEQVYYLSTIQQVLLVILSFILIIIGIEVIILLAKLIRKKID